MHRELYAVFVGVLAVRFFAQWLVGRLRRAAKPGRLSSPEAFWAHAGPTVALDTLRERAAAESAAYEADADDLLHEALREHWRAGYRVVDVEWKLVAAAPGSTRTGGLCGVCYAPAEASEAGSFALQCPHVFHSECLELCLAESLACPTCRAPVPCVPRVVQVRPP